MEQSAKKGVGDYFKSFREDVPRIIKFVSCVLVFLSPLIPWLRVRINKTSQPELHSYSENLFGLRGVETMFALLIMLLALIIIVLDMAEYVDAFDKIKNKWFYDPLIEIIISGGLILLVFLATAKTLTDEFEFYITCLGGTVHRTIGCPMAWIGTVGITLTSVLALIKKK